MTISWQGKQVFWTDRIVRYAGSVSGRFISSRAEGTRGQQPSLPYPFDLFPLRGLKQVASAKSGRRGSAAAEPHLLAAGVLASRSVGRPDERNMDPVLGDIRASRDIGRRLRKCSRVSQTHRAASGYRSPGISCSHDARSIIVFRA